jgi:hypothetical protein
VIICSHWGMFVEPPRCQHKRRQGSGSACSDGSSSMSWYCLDCGKSESYSTPAGEPQPFQPLWNAA